MGYKKSFFLAMITVFAVLSDARHIKHKKHLKHGKDLGSKKNRILHVQVKPLKKQFLGGPQGGCCTSAQAEVPAGDPNACCQSASPPPCCQQSNQFRAPMPSQMLTTGGTFTPLAGCCYQAGASMMGQNPFSCCQSASPPPCCQQSLPFQAQLPPSMPSTGGSVMTLPECCYQAGAPPMAGQNPFYCCQSASPPPCCQQSAQIQPPPPPPPPPPMPTTDCCSTAPSPTQTSGIYLGLAHPDQQCCHAINPPPCCFGLHLKPGQSKNITMSGGGKNYVLSVKLSNATNSTGNGNSTVNPCTIPTCAPPTSSPTSGVSSGPTKGPTTSSSGNAASGATSPTSGPSKAPSTKATPGPSMPASGSTSATSPSPTTASSTLTSSGSPAGTQCQKDALAEHNVKRAIHNSPPITLDAQLNGAAQAYADTLATKKKVEHSPVDQRQGQGENLAKRCSKPDSGFSCKAATDMWYDEVSKYDWGSPGYSPLTFHFTQVVWKASTKLGIGKASFVNDAGMTCHVVVGRYKPAGNIKGQFPANVQKGSYVGRRSDMHQKHMQQ